MTIHFIHRVDKTNTGDIVSNAGMYYLFEKYDKALHDIYNPVFDKIKPDDVVIFSGGGLLNCLNVWNVNINRVLDICKNVYGWGVGFNKHKGTRLLTPINFSKFKHLGIRDYLNSYESNMSYLPCSSCNLPQLQKTYEIKRKAGIVEHHHNRINLNGLDKIDNGTNIDDFIKFIGESEVIITNTYHCLYFSTLLNKKCILWESFSEKFNNLKHGVDWAVQENIKQNLQKTGTVGVVKKPDYSGYLEECLDINNRFYNKILKNI